MVMVFGDNLRRKRAAIATYAIAAICVAATLAGAAAPESTVESFGFVPLDFSLQPAASAYRLITAEFIHAGPGHLIGNLLFLLAFGRSIENLLGPVVFIAAFVGLGAFSFLGSWLLAPASQTAIIGISGALSFLVGAYAIVFPRAKLRLFPFFRRPYLRAWFFTATWVALQLFDILTIGERTGGVAYATHLGGVVIGLIAGACWREFALDTDRLVAELTKEDGL